MRWTGRRAGLLLAVAGLVAGFSPFPARADGINLSWDDCGTYGTMAKQFACDTNTGAGFTLFGSFVPPAGIVEFVAISAEIGFRFGSALSVPDWWSLGTGRCRAGALTVSTDFTSGPYNCADNFFGQATTAFDYTETTGVGAARLVVQAELPADIATGLDPSIEYYGFRIHIAPAKTVGTGACVECDGPACINFRYIQLFQPAARNFDPRISVPLSMNSVAWRELYCPPCPCPTVASSWGQLKCLFRNR